MDFITIIFIAIGLAMDSFAVSISYGSALQTFQYKKASTTALVMGIFQAIMPVLGWLLAYKFATYIVDFDHWIAFILLLFLGIKMIYESLKKDNEKKICFSFKTLLVLGVATSIDALAVGISFAFLNINILLPVLIIGITAFLFSFSGVFIGQRFGKIKGLNIGFIGGLILITIGVKILIEHIYIG
ncbi:MAG: manganese efflux pump MntP family protein [Bacteroidales bacterium]|jgi:putative Mn2+ efflux pump MntP|nr:manganese efflux pump MntP family protein [Bacteroidales bacterium]